MTRRFAGAVAPAATILAWPAAMRPPAVIGREAGILAAVFRRDGLARQALDVAELVALLAIH